MRGWSLLGLVVGLGGCLFQGSEADQIADPLAYWPATDGAWTFEGESSGGVLSATATDDGATMTLEGDALAGLAVLHLEHSSTAVRLVSYEYDGETAEPDLLLLAPEDELGDTHSGDGMSVELSTLHRCGDLDAWDGTPEEEMCLNLRFIGGPLEGFLLLAEDAWLTHWDPTSGEDYRLTEAAL
jgi:hypothetical protein